MNIFNIRNAYTQANIRKWDKVYWAIDLHGTILRSTYDNNKISTVFYPNAEKILKFLSKKEDVVLIMFTSTEHKFIDEYIRFFISKDINFDYINECPEIINNNYACFDRKFYFNILLDDKGGFEGETDWFDIERELNFIYK